MRSRYLPVFLNVREKKCVVIGGGRVAFKKASTLLRYGAKVLVVSPEFEPEFQALAAQSPGLRLRKKKYEARDLRGARAVFAATSDESVNRTVASEALRLKILANAADQPEHSQFLSPSCLERGDLMIAVSTSGKSPALARAIRLRLELLVEEAYASLVRAVEAVRSELKKEGIRIQEESWRRALDLDVLLGLCRESREAEARDWLRRRLLGLPERAGGA